MKTQTMKKIMYGLIPCVVAFIVIACQAPKEEADYASRTPISTAPGYDVAVTITEERFMSPPAVATEGENLPNVVKDWNSIEMMEYRIGPGDVLAINIYVGMSRQDFTLVVQRDGTITLPLIGMIEVVGKRPEEVQKEIQEKSTTYFVAPAVHLTVSDFKYHHIYVMGLGVKQLDITLKKRMTLFELVNTIGQGSGLETIDLRGAYIQRGNKVYPVDLRRIIEGDLSFNYELEDNDILYLRSLRDQKIFILGEVGRPGVLTMEKDDNLFYALARAGGPTPRAQIHDIRIIRGGLSNPTLITVDIAVMFGRRAPRVLNTEDLTRLNISAAAARKNSLALETLYLQNEDFIFVPKTALAAWNDIMAQIAPTLSFIYSTPAQIISQSFMLSNAISGP